ncbi:MAG: SPFH domain-containing protein [Defluviitaleaceae bacterium]|nr:SPFH domain-containing protein [Defluviitaleaceae bacterium]
MLQNSLTFLSSAAEADGGNTLVSVFIAIGIIVVVFFCVAAAILSRYRKCPSDKVMVIYGRVKEPGGSIAAKCVHGGATFVWPVIQSYQYLDLTPISIGVDLKGALSRQNIRVDVPSKFTVGISTEPTIMQNAAERLLGLKSTEVQDLARDIIFGQLRLVIATMDIEEINTDRDKFLAAVSHNVESELKKIGLRLINVNMTDITDEVGYLQALGKEAAAKAINDAKISVAEKDRDGNIGAANAERDQRISVASANAEAVRGVNEAQMQIAKTDAMRRESEAEANRAAVAAEKIAEAKALEESYAAQQEAELARAKREQAIAEADIIVKAEIEKRKIEIDAEANAEKIRRQAKADADVVIIRMEAEAKAAEANAEKLRKMAKGEADAHHMKAEADAHAQYAVMNAQARGTEELLSKQAAGLMKIMESAGGDADTAVKMMIADKLENIVKTQVEAIKNLKFDKITVWDGAGKDATANFASGLMKSLPPLNDLLNMTGLSLPGFLQGNKQEEVAIEEE